MWINHNSTNINERDDTAQIETSRWQLLEKQDKALECVQELEHALKISTRWTIGSKKWNEAEKLVTTWVYRQCLDRLEGGLVSQLFELTKMNRSGTGMQNYSLVAYTKSMIGYKAHRHIGKALKARSHAI